jgi:hypothetical protein
MATSVDNQRLKWQQNRQQTSNTPVTLTLKPAWTGLVGRFNDHRCLKKEFDHGFQDEKAQFTASAEPAPVKVSPGNAATAF